METKTKTSGLKVGLVVSIALIVVLALFSMWAYSEISNLRGRVNSLETDNDNLETQVSNLQTDKANLQTEVNSLKAPQLHKVEVYWTDNHPWFASPYIDYYGTIFNSGSQTAYSVVLTVRIYDAYDTLLKTEEIHLGNIYGKSYETFDVDIGYSGDADYITTTLSYS